MFILITDTCGHLNFVEPDCELEWTNIPAFKTGRSDCTPDPDLERPFFTKKHEIHPNQHGNGPAIVDYYKKNFDFTARESMALTLGAHSFGKFNSDVSMFKYFWTREQQNILNNQMFRNVAMRPQYFLNCKNHKDKDEFILVGDAYGNRANTTWVTTAHGFAVGGGSFQWFHRYNRYCRTYLKEININQ